jgi:hypothetical protein
MLLDATRNFFEITQTLGMGSALYCRNFALPLSRAGQPLLLLFQIQMNEPDHAGQRSSLLNALATRLPRPSIPSS